MRAELEDFGNGWFGLSLGIRKEEIDMFIERLLHLKENNEQHFHLAGDFQGSGGLGDIEVYVQENGPDNMGITGLAIAPNR